MSKSPNLRAYSGWIRLAQRLNDQGPPLLHAMAMVGINRLQVAKGCDVTSAAVAQWAAYKRPIPARHKANLIAFLSVWSDVARRGGVKLSVARKVKRIASQELQGLDNEAQVLCDQHRRMFRQEFKSNGTQELQQRSSRGSHGSNRRGRN